MGRGVELSPKSARPSGLVVPMVAILEYNGI